MTALQLTPGGLGYGPARAARLESERAMRRALPASFVFVTGLLLVLSIAQRLVPAAPIVVDVGPLNPHAMTGLVDPTPPVAPVAVSRVAPAVTADRVPLPVPDAVAPRAEPDGGASARPAAGPVGPGGGGSAPGEGVPAVETDPVPGGFVYTDQLPARVLFVAPEYPDMAREAGVEGTVMLWALVDLDGSVKAVQVIHSVPLLDAAAGTALRRWRFTPALANGHPERVWVAVPVKFSLH